MKLVKQAPFSVSSNPHLCIHRISYGGTRRHPTMGEETETCMGKCISIVQTRHYLKLFITEISR